MKLWRVLTRASQRTRYSSIKLLKYWSRNSNPGPRKAKSWRCISLFVICATWGRKKIKSTVCCHFTTKVKNKNIILYLQYLQLIYLWFLPRHSQRPGCRGRDVSQRAERQTSCRSSSPKWSLNRCVKLGTGRWFPESADTETNSECHKDCCNMTDMTERKYR